MAVEPSPRWGHCSALVDGKLYLWGGRTREFSKEKSTLTSTLHVFDPFVESWETKSTTGPPPPGVYSGASASAGHHIYQYGGHDGSAHHGTFHCLDTTTLQWTELPSGDATEKSGCGMTICGDKLILFGGFGVASGPTQAGAEFIKADRFSVYGRTNEFHVFDLKEGEELFVNI